jgi:hypothetical protein
LREAPEQHVESGLELAGPVPVGQAHADAHEVGVVGPVADELADDGGGRHVEGQQSGVAEAEGVGPERVVDAGRAVGGEARLEQRAHEGLHPAPSTRRADHPRRDEGQSSRVRLYEQVQAGKQKADLVAPVGLAGRQADGDRRDRLGHAVEDRLLVGEMVVEAHRLDAGVGGESSHVQRAEALAIDDRQGELDDALTSEEPALAALAADRCLVCHRRRLRVASTK